jgi:hypothetical protein
MSVLRIQLSNIEPNIKIICEENKKTTLRIYIFILYYLFLYEFRLIPVKHNKFIKRLTHTLLCTIKFYRSWLCE